MCGSRESLEQDRDDGLHVEALQVSVGLSSAHKHYRLPCGIGHGDGRTHLRGEGEREGEVVT